MSPRKTTRKVKSNQFKLPKYLRLAKGSMWFDVEGENASGVKLYSIQKKLVSRQFEMTVTIDQDGKEKKYPKATEVAKDENQNNNTLDFGKNNHDLPWYVDTSEIPPEKLSRILLAYKYGILVEADPNNPPNISEEKISKQFQYNNKGDRIFVGKNTEMYTKLQNLNFKNLQDFVRNCPSTKRARENIQDMYEYEIAGHNPLSRPRQEVLDLLRKKLSEYGPGISSIRVNED